jgi:transcriptional regulator with XRE-family HTH domain
MVAFNRPYMSTLQARMEEFVRETKWSVTQIADTAKVTPSAVSQWLGKGAKTIQTIGNIEAAINLERATGYSALWLAKGKGPKKPTSTTPRTAPVSLLEALAALGDAIENAPEAARKGAVMMLTQYLESPSSNSDVLPLIAKRLSGELSTSTGDSTSGKWAA